MQSTFIVFWSSFFLFFYLFIWRREKQERYLIFIEPFQNELESFLFLPLTANISNKVYTVERRQLMKESNTNEKIWFINIYMYIYELRINIFYSGSFMWHTIISWNLLWDLHIPLLTIVQLFLKYSYNLFNQSNF